MAPYAVCTNLSCAFAFDIGEDLEPTGPSHLPPDFCPRCRASLLLHCPACFAPIVHIPTCRRPRCQFCGWLLMLRGLPRAAGGA